MSTKLFVLVVALVVACASATPSVPTLPVSWSGTCNATVDVPFVGLKDLVGPCWNDGVGKRTRQDYTATTPFGSVQAVDVHWWAETYTQCVDLQGPSTCSYFDPSHIHSVDYKITSSSFGSHCDFTYKENVKSVACSSDCQQFPNMVIPGDASYSTSTVNGVACDVWSWSMSSPAGSVSWVVYVETASPTTIVRYTFSSEALGMRVKQDVFVTDFDDSQPADSVFTLSSMQGCTLKTNTAKLRGAAI